MTGPAGPVCVYGSLVARCCAFRRCQHAVLRPRRARCGEKCTVRLLRRMGEVTLKAVEEDRGAAFRGREGLAPQPRRETKAGMGTEDRIRPLARQIGRRARDADADRVELSLESDPTELVRAKERFGV